MVRKRKLLLLCFMTWLSIIFSAANMTLIVMATPGTTIYVDPASIVDYSLVPTSTFNVNVTVREVTDLYLWDFRLSFDAALLECVDAVEPYPPADQIWQFFVEEIDNVAGTVHVVGGRPFGIKVGLDGTWKLATLVFSVKAEGSCLLHYHHSELRHTNNELIPHDVEDGYFSNSFSDLPSEVHDIAVNVAAYPTAVPQGEPIYIDVTVVNQGDFPETLDLTVYADRNVFDIHVDIGSETVSLDIGESKLLEFVWDTTDVPYGCYWVTAEAILPEDTDPEDNIARAFVGGICVPRVIQEVSLLTLLAPTASVILALATLGIAEVVFLKILGSSRPRWPWRLSKKDYHSQNTRK